MSYEGRRIRHPSSDRVYLVMEGVRRWIPSLAAHDRLFDSWDVEVTAACDSVPLGPDFSADVVIAQWCPTCGIFPSCAEPLYLFSNGKYRHIVNPDVFNRYHFSWKEEKRRRECGGAPPPALLGPPIV